ncbi:MAG: hypothetical protein V1722_01525 [Candidatus Micrarchaeota archaeon]
MAKKVVKKTSAMSCDMCSGKDCSCRKINACAKILMALALLGYAAGYLTLPLAAGVVGILVGVSGVCKLMKSC